MIRRLRFSGKRSTASGFSLIEAMVSIVIFALATAVIFGASNMFFKAWKKHEQKQDLNREFVKIYSSVNKELPLSDTGYFSCYSMKNLDSTSRGYEEKRWFLFPVPTDEKGLYQCDSDGVIRWTRIIVYYILPSENDSCNKSDPLRFCPHKRLVKTTYFFNQADALRFNEFTPLDNLIARVGEVILPPESSFPNLDGLTFYSSKTLADNILDLEVSCTSKGRVDFDMSVVRLDDALKGTGVGNVDFKSEPGKKYVEHLGWSCITP